MSESIRIIALELAMRFLNDYINGDTYFKINYPTHNLDRARNQLALVKDIENKMDDIKAYIEEYIASNQIELTDEQKWEIVDFLLKLSKQQYSLEEIKQAFGL